MQTQDKPELMNPKDQFLIQIIGIGVSMFTAHDHEHLYHLLDLLKPKEFEKIIIINRNQKERI